MPRYIFNIEGQPHVFEGPNQAATAEFARQWAATAGRPGYEDGERAADPLTGYGMTAARAIPGLTELGAGYSAALRSAADLAAGRRVQFGARWNQARGEQQGVVDRFQSQHPLASANATGLGAIAPAVMSLPLAASGAAPSLIASGTRTVPALVRGAIGGGARNALTGAAVAGTYGLSRPGTLNQRAAAAAGAIPGGAVAGAVVPAALEGLGGLALARAARSRGSEPIAGLVAHTDAQQPIARLAGPADGQNPIAERAAPGDGQASIASPAAADGQEPIAAPAAPPSVQEPIARLVVDHIPYSPRVGQQVGVGSQGENVVPLSDEFLLSHQQRQASLADLPEAQKDEYQSAVDTLILDPYIDDPDQGGHNADQVASIRAQLSALAEQHRQPGGMGARVADALDGANEDFTTMVNRYQPEIAKQLGIEKAVGPAPDGPVDAADDLKSSGSAPPAPGGVVSFERYVKGSPSYDPLPPWLEDYFSDLEGPERDLALAHMRKHSGAYDNSEPDGLPTEPGNGDPPSPSGDDAPVPDDLAKWMQSAANDNNAWRLPVVAGRRDIIPFNAGPRDIVPYNARPQDTVPFNAMVPKYLAWHSVAPTPRSAGPSLFQRLVPNAMMPAAAAAAGAGSTLWNGQPTQP